MKKSYCKVWLAALAGVVLLTSILVAQGLVFKWEPFDDAYISFRYAQNFADGHGLVFNQGERVEGFTNFLWTMVIAAAAWFKLDLPWAAQWLGVAFASLGLVLTWCLALRVAEERNWPKSMAFVPPLILACYPGCSYNAFSGMEGPFLTCLILAFLLVGCRPRATAGELIIAGVLGFLAAMTRWETVLLWPIVVMLHLLDTSHTVRQRFKRAVLLSLVLVAGFGIYFVCRLWYYGELMPNTYYMKMGADLLTRTKMGMVYAGELAVEWLLPFTFLSWLLRPRGRWTIVLTLSLIVYIGYVTWTAGDTYPWLRFYQPVLPVVAILATDFIERIVATVPSIHLKNRAGLMRFALTSAMVLTIWGISARIDYLGAVRYRRFVNNYKKVGRWANTCLPPEYRLGICPVGVVGYYSQRQIVDILGLVDYEVAHYGQIDTSEAVGHQKSNIDLILRRKPEVILGNAVVFNRPPTVEETIMVSSRSVLKKMLKLPEFKQLYEFKVAEFEQVYIPYWIDRSLEEISNPRSTAAMNPLSCEDD